MKFSSIFQVLITDDLIPQMVAAFECLTENFEASEEPKVFEWPDKSLKIIIANPNPVINIA